MSPNFQKYMDPPPPPPKFHKFSCSTLKLDKFYVCYYFNLLTLKILVPLMHSTMLKLFLFALFITF